MINNNLLKIQYNNCLNNDELIRIYKNLKNAPEFQQFLNILLTEYTPCRAIQTNGDLGKSFTDLDINLTGFFNVIRILNGIRD